MTASSESCDIVGSFGVVTGHSLVVQPVSQLLQAATQQRGDRRDGPADPLGDLRERPALAVLQDDHLPHQLGQFRQGLDHPQQLLVPLGPAAGRGLVGGQPGGEPRRGTVQVGLQRTLQADVPLVPLVVLHRVGQRPGQDPPQPGDQHLGPVVAHLRQRRIGPQHRLLDHVGRVELAAKPPVEVQPGQHLEVLAERFQDFRRVSAHGRSSFPLFPRRRRLPADEPRFSRIPLAVIRRCAHRCTARSPVDSDAQTCHPSSDTMDGIECIHLADAPNPEFFGFLYSQDGSLCKNRCPDSADRCDTYVRILRPFASMVRKCSFIRASRRRDPRSSVGDPERDDGGSIPC